MYIILYDSLVILVLMMMMMMMMMMMIIIIIIFIIIILLLIIIIIITYYYYRSYCTRCTISRVDVSFLFFYFVCVHMACWETSRTTLLPFLCAAAYDLPGGLRNLICHRF